MTTAEEEQNEALDELLRAGALWVLVSGGAIKISVNLSDTFGYACADSEDVPLDSLPLVARMFSEYGHHGLTAWSAHVRRADPIKPRITPEYLRAREAIAQATCSPT